MKFKRKYTNYEIATSINTRETETKVATLRTFIGNDAIDVFNTPTWMQMVMTKRSVKYKVLEKLEEYCEPRKNDI